LPAQLVSAVETMAVPFLTCPCTYCGNHDVR